MAPPVTLSAIQPLLHTSVANCDGSSRHHLERVCEVNHNPQAIGSWRVAKVKARDAGGWWLEVAGVVATSLVQKQPSMAQHGSLSGHTFELGNREWLPCLELRTMQRLISLGKKWMNRAADLLRLKCSAICRPSYGLPRPIVKSKSSFLPTWTRLECWERWKIQCQLTIFFASCSRCIIDVMVLGGCRKDPQRLELACKPMQGLSRQAAVNGLQPEQWQRPHASTVLPSCAILRLRRCPSKRPESHLEGLDGSTAQKRFHSLACLCLSF